MTQEGAGGLPALSDGRVRPIGQASSSERGRSAAFWSVVLINAVLLISTALYAAHLHREAETWREAVNQLTIGQDLLRADRDEILDKARERDATFATLEC